MTISPDEMEKHATILYGLVLTLRSSALELLEANEIPSARGMVDTIEMLEVKTRGNLAVDEERMLRSVLTELRMAVLRAETSKRSESAPPSASEKDRPEPQ
jgi:hypothetical protein